MSEATVVSIPSSLARWTRQAWATARLDLRRLRRGRHARARLLLVGLPVLGAGILAIVMVRLADNPFSEVLIVGDGRRTPAASLGDLARVFWPLTLRFVLFLTCLELFSNLFRAEIADRTLHHLFLMPLRREVAVVGKYVSGVAIAFVLLALSWSLTTLLVLAPHGLGAMVRTLVSGEALRQAVAYGTSLLLAVMTYGALFLVAGMLFRSPQVVGVFVWIAEGLSTFLPQSIKQLTIIHYVTSLQPVKIPPEMALAQVAEPARAPVAIAVLLLTSLAGVSAAGLLSRGLQLSYGAND